MPFETTKKYLRVRIIPPSKIMKGSFRTLDIGRKGHHLLIRGKLKSTGKYVTQAVLINKSSGHRNGVIKKARRYGGY